MADVASAEELLLNAVQDLYDAERAAAERLALVADAVTDSEFAQFLREEQPLAEAQQARLEALARALDGEPQGSPNLWQRAIMDDAERDIETVERGPLLDIALIGALRKAKTASAVSYETALGLARHLEREEDADALEAARDEAEVADEELRALLDRQLELLGDAADEEADDGDADDADEA
jgi:ferritin-like metal-binding protein YciE